MARTLAKDRKAKSSPADLPALLARHDFLAALAIARNLGDPVVLRKTLLQAATHYADTDNAIDFNRTMVEAESAAAIPGWHSELAKLHARGGNLPKARELAARIGDESLAVAIAAHAVDRAVRLRTKAHLPEEWHPGFDAVLAAFQKYAAGDDDAARTALEPIGLRSPYLEWKLLLRGLMAFSTGDDTRAIENFQRLSAERLPDRLAAPIRAKIDRDFRAVQTEPALAVLDARYGVLSPVGELVAGLKALRRDLGRDTPLQNAYRAAEPVVAKLAKIAPALVPRLAACFYRAILHHGQPDDMARHRRTFGAPAEDPGFQRLQAEKYEQVDDFVRANQFWEEYEKWLSGAPAGWPTETATRARAILRMRMGKNAILENQILDEEAADEEEDIFFRPRNSNRGKAKRPDPIPHFRKAAELAPDWTEPSIALYGTLLVAGKLDDAEAVARKLLENNPNAVEITAALGDQLALAGRAEEALELRLKELAANPLDQFVRSRAATAHVAVARRHMMAGDLAAATAALDAGADLESEAPAAYLAIRSTIARKAKRIAEADALADRARALPERRLAAVYLLAANAALAKLKPAEKKPFDTEFAAALDAGPTPGEVVKLYSSWEQFRKDGCEYRGHKTLEKKILAAALRTAEPETPGTVFEFESLAMGLAQRKQWKTLGKLVKPYARRWPASPLFPMLQAEVEVAAAKGNPRPYKIDEPIRRARKLVDASTEPQYKALAERIAELERFAAPMHGMFEHLFGGGFGPFDEED